jgi:beta-glucosidase
MYVHHMGTRVPEPEKALKGFKRVSLAAGETKTVELPLKAASLAWWDEKQSGWHVEAEPVRVLIGDSSDDILQTATVRVQ